MRDQDSNLALDWSRRCHLLFFYLEDLRWGAGVTLVLQLAWEEARAIVICHFHSALGEGCGERPG